MELGLAHVCVLRVTEVLVLASEVRCGCRFAGDVDAQTVKLSVSLVALSSSLEAVQGGSRRVSLQGEALRSACTRR